MTWATYSDKMKQFSFINKIEILHNCIKVKQILNTFHDSSDQQQTFLTSFWPHSWRSHSVHWPESPGSFHLCPRRSMHNSCRTLVVSWQSMSLHTNVHSELPTGETFQREGTHLGTAPQEQEHRPPWSVSGSQSLLQTWAWKAPNTPEWKQTNKQNEMKTKMKTKANTNTNTKTKPNQTKPNQTKPNQTKKHIEVWDSHRNNQMFRVGGHLKAMVFAQDASQQVFCYTGKSCVVSRFKSAIGWMTYKEHIFIKKACGIRT